MMIFILNLFDCCRLVFFFSSRRRHTRWPRDWSSDVCSSDLLGPAREGAVDPAQDPAEEQSVAEHDPVQDQDLAEAAETSEDEYARPADDAPGEQRSEERRVGKECRSRWQIVY